MLRPLLTSLALLLATAALPGPAMAQAYPSKPIRIIVPAAPGGTVDILARALAGKLQESMGKPVLVEYKAGAATNIGSDFVAKSAPDGYTLLLNGMPLATNPALHANLPFDPLKDLLAIVEVAEMPNVITVNPSLPAASLKELVQLMKDNPGKYNHGTPGAGSGGHLSGELLAMATDTKLVHVPYKGNAPVVNDHLSGILEVGFLNLPVALPFVKAGKLRALAVTSAKRSKQLPEVPTVAEALGIDYQLTAWFGLLAPAGTPPGIIAKLQKESEQALQDPAVRQKLEATGAEAVGGTSADFARKLRDDTARLTDVLRRSGATAK